MCSAVKHHERNIKLVFFPVDLLLESTGLIQEPIGAFLLSQFFCLIYYHSNPEPFIDILSLFQIRQCTHIFTLIFKCEHVGLVQEDRLTYVDYQQTLEIISIQSDVKKGIPLSAPKATPFIEMVQSSVTAARIDKGTSSDEVRHKDSKIEQQCSPSDDCPNTWRSAFIILSLIVSILFACMKQYFESSNGTNSSSTIQLKAEIDAKEVAYNKKSVILQRLTETLLTSKNECFLELEIEKTKNKVELDKLVTSYEMRLSNDRNLQLIDQADKSRLDQLINDNTILNSRVGELEELNKRGIELIDLANTDKLQLSDLNNDNQILNKRIVELEALNMKEHALHIVLQETYDEIFTSKDIAMREINDVKVSLNNCNIELESTRRIADGMIAEKKISDDHIVMLQSQIKENKAKLNEMSTDNVSLVSRVKELENIVSEADIIQLRMEAKEIEMNNQLFDDKNIIMMTKKQSSELQIIINDMVNEQKISAEAVAQADFMRVQQLDLMACSEKAYIDKFNVYQTVISELEKKVGDGPALSYE
jgi:hypothetical protein